MPVGFIPAAKTPAIVSILSAIEVSLPVSVVYQEKLGTSYEKMERFKAVAGFLAEKLCSDKKESVEKTAYLCKADLLSEMVYEFPELQGIMENIFDVFS